MSGREGGRTLCFGGPVSCFVRIMPSPKRICPAGHVLHLLNRAVARWTPGATVGLSSSAVRGAIPE